MLTIRTYRDRDVYRNAMELVVRVFAVTASFPSAEKFSLTDQMRRSSRSVCANIAEAWKKRRYAAAFVAKLNDAEAEAAETQVWSEIAFRHGYLDEPVFRELDTAYESVLAQLATMAGQPEKWVLRPGRR
jgi:four helix bundle protein